MSDNRVLCRVFNTPMSKYVYDTNRNAIINISDDTYNFLKKNKERGLEDLEELPNEVKLMMQEGFLSSNKVCKIEHSLTEYLEDILDNKLQTLTLQVTQQCNLRCEYCAYSGTYTNRRHSDKIMDFEMAKKGIDFLVSHSQNSKILNLSFYGGEPILEFDLIKKCIEYIKVKAEGKKITYNITTNATLLNETHIEYLASNDVSLTISLDGPKEIHDKSRKFAVSGKGTFDIIVSKMKKFKEQFPDYYQNINFNCVLDPRNDISCINEFWAKDELLKDSFVNASFISTDNLDEAKRKELLVQTYSCKFEYEMFKMFLSKLGRYNKDKVSKIAEASFDTIKNSLFTMRNMANQLPEVFHHGGVCVPGTRKLFMDIQGNLFPCEKCSETSPVMKIGNIGDGFYIEKVERLLNIGKISKDRCKNCWAIRLCNLCAVAVDDGQQLSEKKKQKACKEFMDAQLEWFLYYCMLKEYGYDFDDLKIVSFKTKGE